MGLAGPSKKRKISHDPNNTTWSRSEGFGHRILTAQGWSQGTVLGPDPNNPHHTAASQVGIKVMLKDDTLGLGCKGTQEDTCTGLGDLQSLLGRLNGRSDESVKREEDTRQQLWIAGRYGMRFVKGEVLESTWVLDGLKETGTKDDNGEKEEEDVDDDSDASEEQTTDSAGGEVEPDSDEKEKKRKKKRKSTDEESDRSASSAEESKSDKKQRKAEKALRKAERAAKREQKEAKRLRKDEKRRAKAEKKALASAIAASITPSSTARTSPIPTTKEPEPTSKEPKKSKSLPNSLPTSGTSTPVTGRQALRSKWIAQKKMALMDAKALNEILMIKA
ncbi:telomerase inhibitor [Orbilia brochopaga]|uniref:Telomerase inhibitor n=1 Tax=Orbilia brochopaga TaxID=3140254 RepID=A0AAV9U2B4_9PEZI